MRNFHKLSLLALLLLCSGAALAQTKVGGTVTDENGAPMGGVTIVEEGTLNGTTSSSDGTWSLRTRSADAQLRFSFMGYEQPVIAVGGNAVIDVRMQVEANILNEVVVVGYGVQKKVNVTGAVSSIDFSKQAESRPILNVSSSLAGLAPGLGVQQGSGQPGSEGTTLRIRGNTTLGANNPLVLVDGVVWNMNDVNPNDIESVSVLKDASSTAIYGSRGANGVILITTKKGDGRAKVTYSYTGIVQMPYNNLEFVSDYARHMELVNEAAENVSTSKVFSQENIDMWRAAKLDPNGLNKFGVPNYVAYPNTNWFDELFHTGYSQEHNLQVSGGSDKVNYLLSLGYLDNQGIMNRWNLDSSTQRYSVRANIEAKVLKWLTVGTRLLGQKQDYGLANISNGFNYLYQTTPGLYPGEPNYWGVPANASEESSNANNIFSHMAGSTGYNKYYRVNGSLYTVISPMKGLTAEATFNYSPQFRDRSSYSRPNGRWDYVNDTRYSESALANASITNGSSQIQRINAEALLRYNTTIAEDHDLGVLAGYSESYEMSKGYSTSKRGATDWSLHDLSTYSEVVSSESNPEATWGLRSWFARINYGYKEKYLFEGNFRYDASSRFGTHMRWGFFPSFSAGWRITEEPFMESVRPVLSNLKLRASWGRAGNESSLGNYDWQAAYEAVNVVTEGSPTKGLIRQKLANRNLHWETTTTTDIGLEFGLLRDRLSGEIDFYNRYTDGILHTPDIYISMGLVEGSSENIAEVVNRGLEFSLNWNDKVGRDFRYSVGVNFAYNWNRVEKYKGRLDRGWTYDNDGNKIAYHTNFSDVAQGGFGGYIAEGQKIGETYIRSIYRGSGAGYSGSGDVDVNAGPRDGMIRTEADMAWVRAMIDAGYKFNGMNTVNNDQLWYGDFIYADTNGNGNYGEDNDRNFTGHTSQPVYNLGINLSASWKGIDFSMLWAGAFGHYLIWNASYYNSAQVNNGHGIISHIADDHYFYDPANPEDPRTNTGGKYPRLTYNTSYSNNLQSDWYEYKGDYLKLKNITLGYTLPENITRKFFVSRLRFYVSAENLLTITKYPGQDPEIGTKIGYPLMRQVSFGAQVTF